MPTYEYICSACKHEWEEFHEITREPTKICPACGAEQARRLISGGAGKGIVELTGLDLQNKIKEDTNKLKNDAAAKEKVLANLVGESRYHELQTRVDRAPRRR